MKRNQVIFWTATIFIFLFEGVMPAFTSQTALAKEGIRHLGYPEYFGNILVVFKVLGALALVVPQVPKSIKEWAYAGFTFSFTFAFLSHLIVDGFNVQTLLPLIIFAFLAASYVYFHKLNAKNYY